MLWKLALRTLIAAAVIALLAGAWQIVAGTAGEKGTTTHQVSHDDD